MLLKKMIYYIVLLLNAIGDIQCAIAVLLAMMELVVVYIRHAHLLSVFFNISLVSVSGLPAQIITPLGLIITA